MGSAPNLSSSRLKVNKAMRFPLKISAPTPHLLQGADGEPFFLLGDTAWELFHRLTLEEAEEYLEVRREQGFTQIWAVALAEFEGIRKPNRNGDLPFLDEDPRRPNEPYWEHVDAVIAAAATKGLGVGLLPTWGDKVTENWGDGPVIFDTPEVAFDYGKWIGARYAASPEILWVNGGDRPVRTSTNDWLPIWRALAQGIRAGGATQLMTYHPQGGPDSTSVYIHDENWLDINAMQSGHGGGRDVPVADLIARDRDLIPWKPTLDAEPNYEDHPISPWPTWDRANGHYDDYDVRRQTYRSLFAGACGVVYGHHSVWQFASDREPWINNVLMDWRTALTRPGAHAMRYLRELFEERDWGQLWPFDQLLVDAGAGLDRCAVVRGPSYYLVYRSSPRPLALTRKGPFDVSRMDPRTGEWTHLGSIDKELPSDGPSPDAVFRLNLPPD